MVESAVTLADGNKTKVSGVGEGIVYYEDCSGNRVEITLQDVLFVPGLDSGLISVGCKRIHCIFWCG